MNTFIIGQDLKTDIVSGLTINNEQSTLYLWSLRVSDSNRRIKVKASQSNRYRTLIRHLEDKVFEDRVRLLFMKGNFRNEYILKVRLEEHPILVLLNLILNNDIIKENKDLTSEFLYNILNKRYKNSVELVKGIGITILNCIDKIEYNIEDEEVKELLSLLYLESINSQTLVSMVRVGNGNLELHKSLVKPPMINGINQPDKLNFVPIEKIAELNRYKGSGIKTDEHHVGYHFHYCEKVRGGYEYTRYLLSYNVNEKGHLMKLPSLYWEIHKENNVKSSYRLSSNKEFRRAVYHKCNSERRKLFKGLRKTEIKQLKFRPKSDEAEIFYNPVISEVKQNKKRYSQLLYK
ncbi:hypothetical protein [Litchfieldia salsa]|uniref:Uncharacterized protein n=1 Tax=Litchfieldia salsa TaxID=930152 RepID=A0A1H0PME4_9BACI|nr:hypothetical protein [Litchfieldia salsa]SDP06261.1 hypothetical protein SAMN05216565_101385 [Litchfieldia salsa]